MNPYVLMVSSLKSSTLHSLTKSLGFKIPIPAVACLSFLPFRGHVISHLGAVVSTVALDLPTKSTSICFPSVNVSVSWRKVRMFVCVLRVLMKSLMTRGDRKLRQGRRPIFFIGLNLDVREIVVFEYSF
jgi:hypothetical protein